MAEGEGCVPTGTVLVTQSMENRPPVITKVTFDPPRRYFQLGSSVTVTATAIDPDGDQVSITYQPGHAFTVNNLGTLVVTTLAEDSKGARSAERRDTLFGVFVNIAGDAQVEDGKAAGKRVECLPPSVSPSSFEWTREPANPAGGNEPQRGFEHAETNSTVTIPNAKWYADPDEVCTKNQTPEYNLTAFVTIGGDLFEAKTKLVVHLPRPAARMKPQVKITGEPTYVRKIDNSGATYYGIGEKNTLKREILDDIPTYLLSESSQFMRKAKVHEEVHQNQYTTGIARDFHSLDVLWERIRDFRAPNSNALSKIFCDYLETYKLQEESRKESVCIECEREAYRVSDPIAPQYFYQGQCSGF